MRALWLVNRKPEMAGEDTDEVEETEAGVYKSCNCLVCEGISARATFDGA